VIKRKILKGIVLWVVGLIWLGLLPVSQSMAQVDRVVQVAIDTVKKQLRLPGEIEVRFIEKRESPIPDFYSVQLLPFAPDKEVPLVVYVDKAGEKVFIGSLPRKFIQGDAFEVLRSLGSDYNVAILDPSPFAKKKGALPKAARGYKDLNLQAFRLLRREGLLFTFSCSHHMDWDLFQKIVFSAAVDAGRRVQLIGRMSHPVDHPIDICHPEGEYLKGLICKAE